MANVCCFEVVHWLARFLSRRCLTGEAYDALRKGGKKQQQRLLTAGGKIDSSDDEVLDYNVIVNPTFSDGTNGWVAVGYSLAVETSHSVNYCVARNRKGEEHGVAQEIGKRLEDDSEYKLEAWVGVRNGQTGSSVVQAYLKLQREVGDAAEYILLGSVHVGKGQWSLITSTLKIDVRPREATLYFHGPDAGTDILISSVAVVPAPKTELTLKTFPEKEPVADIFGAISSAVPPFFKDPKYGVNIVNNSNLDDGLNWWYAMGDCKLKIIPGAPRKLGVAARNSFVNCAAPTLSGKSLHASGRTETWEGPAQDITDRIQLFQTYQIFAWVATALPRGSVASVKPQMVNLAFDIDGEWVNGGEVPAGADWVEVSGSLRLEKKFRSITVYVQGPEPGVEVMLSGLQIFAVDRLARVPQLQQQTDEIRKRDVSVTLRDSQGRSLRAGTKVSVRQTKNAFPLGSAITHTAMGDAKYENFFLENFNWAVFDYELKWPQVEWNEGDLDYSDVDTLVRFCNRNNISKRGHCITWEVEENAPQWVQGLEGDSLVAAVQRRFSGLLNRYKGEFKHYDVNNEMLHGSFYRSKLGPSFWSYMFKLAEHCDADATLFVNDFHIEDGEDANSTPDKYVEQIKFLQNQGANVGGIGVQGHVSQPIGPMIADALNKLGELNIPIWFTEVDLESVNEHVRADDLEVVLREAYAHPSVEGCVLWGFMESSMTREDAHLICSDGRITAAGRRLQSLKKEWTTNFDALVDENGEINFRGYHGSYSFKVDGKSSEAAMEVTKGNGVQTVNLVV